MSKNHRVEERRNALPLRGVLAGIVALAGALTGCSRHHEPTVAEEAARLTGGDPVLGKAAIQNYGCYSCHIIPGITGANGTAGPSLAQVGSHPRLAGGLQNTPENMMRWIRTPHSVLPKTLMPEMGVSQKDARNISAYLYTLR